MNLKTFVEDKPELSETDAIADTIKSGNIGIVLLTFLGFGLLLAMTPCVFPMIPIISGIIVSQGEGLTTRKAFMLSVVYVLAMAVAYTISRSTCWTLWCKSSSCTTDTMGRLLLLFRFCCPRV
ncbi:MAG: hypothetical protein Q9M40_07445 [Sulfurimonas sp.]|nr:hypothetical protein [Sulfurimonas sp.]